MIMCVPPVSLYRYAETLSNYSSKVRTVTEWGANLYGNLFPWYLPDTVAACPHHIFYLFPALSFAHFIFDVCADIFSVLLLMYMMAPPTTSHQRISYAVARKISDYIDQKKGNCEVFLAPFAVFLDQDDKNYVEPDISIICDKNKLSEKGCNGAPDWIIEVTSPSNPQNDYGIKLFKYRIAKVREYWIINPQKRSVMVYDLENEEKSNQYTFEDDVPACIYEDLNIRISEILR